MATTTLTAASSAQFYDKLFSRILDALRQGTQLDTSSENAVCQYIFAVMALAAGLIPTGGLVVSSALTLLGTVLFSGPTEKVWQLIDRKIESYHLQLLMQKIKGFQTTYIHYSKCMEDYDKATDKEEKKLAANSLKIIHTVFSTILQADIPLFQLEQFAVASLPLFTMAATLHLMLLVDGMRMGLEWGYTPANVKHITETFYDLTTPGSEQAPGHRRDRRDRRGIHGSGVYFNSSQVHCNISHGDSDKGLLDASLLGDLDSSSDSSLPTEVLDLWQGAYMAVYEPQPHLAESSNSGLVSGPRMNSASYVDYVNETYYKGRSLITWDDSFTLATKVKDGMMARAFSEYDTRMALEALNIADLWPFMANASEGPQPSVDREIFLGPYGDGKDGATWDEKAPAPVVRRHDGPVDSITLLSPSDSASLLGIIYNTGDEWHHEGKRLGAGDKQNSLRLGEGENITSITVAIDDDIRQLTFNTSKNRVLEYKRPEPIWDMYEVHTYTGQTPVGHELSSIRLVRDQESIDNPETFEFTGVILGYRPIL